MDAKQTRLGIILALAAYFIWGIAPAYFKLIYYVPADEILTHRVIWSFFFMVALISVSLGVLNLLPLPVLDGGDLMYYLWEAVTGHPVSESWMQGLQRVGIGILVLLMAVAVFNDIQRLFAA